MLQPTLNHLRRKVLIGKLEWKWNHVAFTDMIGTAAVRISRSRNTCYVAWVRSLMGGLHPDGLKVSHAVLYLLAYLSRCPIFRQHPAKMAHLSAGHGLFIVHLFCCHIICAVKMSHLSSAPCQDGTSLGRSWSVHCSPVLLSYHKCCQGVPSFVSTLTR